MNKFYFRLKTSQSMEAAVEEKMVNKEQETIELRRSSRGRRRRGRC